MDGIMRESYPVSAKTGLSFDDYRGMGVERHRLREAKTVPLFAQNDAMFRRVILLKVWRYCKRGPMPENLKLADVDTAATHKALNPEFGFETIPAKHRERVEQHAEAIRRCGGYASFCSAIAYRAWRLRWNSLAIAEEMKLTPERVRQTLSRLVSIADELGFPTYEKRHHSKGKPKNFKGVSRDGRVYGREKAARSPLERHKSPVYLVGPRLQTAIAMRGEGKPLKEISAACGGTCSTTISTTLCRLGLGVKRFQFDVAAFNALRTEGKTLAEIAKAFGVHKNTLSTAIHHHRQRHGCDSVLKQVPQFTKVNVEQAAGLREQGKTWREIAEVLGTKTGTLLNAMYKAGALKPRQKLDIEKIKTMRAEGHSLTEIGNELGVSASGVCHALRRAGAYNPAPLGRPPKIDVEQAVALSKQGKTLREIAEVFGASSVAVMMALRKAGAYNPAPVGRPPKVVAQ